VELYLHSPNTPSWRGAHFGGAQGQLYLLHLIVGHGTPDDGWRNKEGRVLEQILELMQTVDTKDYMSKMMHDMNIVIDF
jgi:hypothetical protein